MPFFPVPTGAESELKQFLLFIKEFGKKYSPSMLERRFEIFQENLKRIAQLNAENDDVEFGITEFADLTPEEFVQIRLLDLKGGPELFKTHPDLPTDDLPQSWDWREKGAVTAVRNQGSCGSCWAFSAVENIEGQHFIKTGNLVTLSPQQVVDCDALDCNCHGGFPTNAYKYVQTTGGLMSDDQYKYCVPPAGNCFVCAANSTCNSSVFHTYYCNEVCRFDPKSAVATISDALAVSSDEAQMAAALVKVGPLSACFNANHLMFYWRGILNPWICDAKEFNHAVLIVGYGVERNKPYWIVKNSWGSRWGEAGYFRIIRGKGKCGINRMVTSAIA